MSAPLTLAHSHPQRPPAPTADPAPAPLELGTLFAALRRQQLRLVLAVFLGLGAGLAWLTQMAVPTYLATASVVLETRTQQIVDLEGVISGLSGDSVDLNTQVAVLKSHSLMARVVDDLGLTDQAEFQPNQGGLAGWVGRMSQWLGLPRSDPSPLTFAVARLQDKLRIRNLPQSLVFELSVETRDPALSVAIVDRLATLYIDEQLAAKTDLTQQAITWLSARVIDLERDLAQAETAVKDFVGRTDLISADALADLQRQAKDLRQSILVAQAEQDRVLARLRVLDQPVDRLTEDSLAGLHETELLAAFRDQRGGDRTARARFAARLDRLRARAAADRDRLSEGLTVLLASQATLEQRISDQASDLITLEQLEREAEATRQQYAYFLTRFKETSVQIGIQRPDARLLSAAVLPETPHRPNGAWVLTLSMAIGLGLGVIWALGRDAQQLGFKTALQLELATGQKVLGQIPRLPKTSRRAVLQTVRSDHGTAFGEAVRNLRTSVMSLGDGRGPQVVLFTSSVPGEGKTSQALAMAQNLRALGRKVLLIEGDVRRRVFRHYFKPQGGTGLVAALSDPGALGRLVVTDDALGIDILACEDGLPNAADVFESQRFATLMQRARQLYDHILIDSPPVLAVTDARVLGRQADAILYVVKWDSTPPSQVQAGLAQLQGVALQADGLVLSQIDQRALKRLGYGGYYGAGADRYYAKSA